MFSWSQPRIAPCLKIPQYSNSMTFCVHSDSRCYLWGQQIIADFMNRTKPCELCVFLIERLVTSATEPLISIWSCRTYPHCMLQSSGQLKKQISIYQSVAQCTCILGNGTCMAIVAKNCLHGGRNGNGTCYCSDHGYLSSCKSCYIHRIVLYNCFHDDKKIVDTWHFTSQCLFFISNGCG